MTYSLANARTILAGVLCLTASALAIAQPLPPGRTVTQFSISGLNQFDTGMDGGGSFSWADASGSLRVLHQFTPTVSAGVSAEYAYQKWNWSNPAAFGSRQPWGAINTTKLGLSFGYAPSPDLRFMIAPSVEWAGETGVGTADSAIYGALLTATKTFSPDLTLGIGAGVYRELDETRAFPFLLVNWKISDQWTLKNPLPAGPAGGAGLELQYSPNDRWAFGLGGAWRNYRFRLNDSGPFAGGIGQNRLIPVFARVSYAFTPTTSLDFYAVAMFAGNVQAQSADKMTTLNTGYSTGFGLAVNFSHRF